MSEPDSEMDEVAAAPTREGAEAVADKQWQRVRDLARVAERLAQEDAIGELDEGGQMRLARARIRAARATDRAILADELADRMAELRPPT
jgi:hypothetical protein